MGRDTARVLKAALALPDDERRELVALLGASLGVEDDRPLLAEVRRRAWDVVEGRAILHDAEEVFARVAAALGDATVD